LRIEKEVSAVFPFCHAVSVSPAAVFYNLLVYVVKE